MHGKSVINAWRDKARAADIYLSMEAAQNVRCACGSYGSWDRSIRGTSGAQACTWAGCTNCRGQALGAPISSSDLAWFRRYIRRHGAVTDPRGMLDFWRRYCRGHDVR